MTPAEEVDRPQGLDCAAWRRLDHGERRGKQAVRQRAFVESVEKDVGAQILMMNDAALRESLLALRGRLAAEKLAALAEYRAWLAEGVKLTSFLTDPSRNRAGLGAPLLAVVRAAALSERVVSDVAAVWVGTAPTV